MFFSKSLCKKWYQNSKFLIEILQYMAAHGLPAPRVWGNDSSAVNKPNTADRVKDERWGRKAKMKRRYPRVAGNRRRREERERDIRIINHKLKLAMFDQQKLVRNNKNFFYTSSVTNKCDSLAQTAAVCYPLTAVTEDTTQDPPAATWYNLLETQGKWWHV